MRRRQFLLTGLASVLATAAAAQEQKADADLDLEPVKGTEELWYLLTALDALIFCLAVAVIKDPAVIIQARREIQPYSSQLSDPKAEEAFNVALKSSDGQARVEQNKTAIHDAAEAGRRVVDRRRLAADPRQPRPCVLAIIDIAGRPRGREPVVVVPCLRVSEGALLAGTATDTSPVGVGGLVSDWLLRDPSPVLVAGKVRGVAAHPVMLKKTRECG